MNTLFFVLFFFFVLILLLLIATGLSWMLDYMIEWFTSDE